MSTMSAEPPTDLHRHWCALVGTYANVLLSGPASILDDILTACAPQVRAPLARRDAVSFRAIPRCRTLILTNIETLDREGQRVLRRWARDDVRRSIQIVATTTKWIYGLVTSGQFDRDLFYRLNTIHLNFFHDERQMPGPDAVH